MPSEYQRSASLLCVQVDSDTGIPRREVYTVPCVTNTGWQDPCDEALCHTVTYLAPPTLQDLIGPDLEVGRARCNEESNTADAVTARTPGELAASGTARCADDCEAEQDS
jgi:hypothetical protein